MNGLEVSHLFKRYADQTVVDDLSFRVEIGEIFGLIGPNGAGKSTTMKMIVGLLKPDGGTISFQDQPYEPHRSGMRTLIGMVPQELAIYPELTAIQNLRFFGRINGVRGRRLRDRVDSVLELTGLARNADGKLSTFSGGMARRLNFGIALLHEPKFIILDEPTVGIDPQSRTSLLEGVRALSRNGMGVLYASHYMEEVEAICDRIAIMDHGRLLKQGTLDELLNRGQVDLNIRVPALNSEIQSRLQPYAEVRNDDQGHTILTIREQLVSSPDRHTGDLRHVLAILEEASIPFVGFHAQETSLETLFLSLTGRTLRD